MINDPPNEPETLSELLWYIMHYQEGIYFRVQRDGKWQNINVSHLTAEEFGEKIAGVIEKGFIPTRVIK